jgi:hypothetical protein
MSHVAIEADVYNASIPKSYGNVFETELLKNVLLAATKSMDHNFTLRSCLWGAGCYNMRDAVQLTETSPCVRNVMPFVKARALELLSMYDIESEYLCYQSLHCCYSRIHKRAGYKQSLACVCCLLMHTAQMLLVSHCALTACIMFLLRVMYSVHYSGSVQTWD